MSRAVAVFSVAVSLTLASAGAAAAVVKDGPQPTASVDGTVYSVVYAGNTVYLGGQFSAATDSSGTVTRHNAAAVNVSSGQLLPWNPNANGAVRALTVVPSGIALGGSFSTVAGKKHTNLAVVNATSGTPTSFSGSVNRVVRSLATGPTGRLYVGGGFTNASGKTRAGLAVFDGNTLKKWAPTAAGGAVLSLHTANGWVFAGGTFTSLNGDTSAGFLAALKPSSTGRLVTSWNAPIGIPVHALDTNASTVYAAADGKGGKLGAYRLTSGAKRWTVSTDGGVQAVTVVGSDVYFGGHFDKVGTVLRRKLGLVSTAGVLQGWDPRANSLAGVCALANDGTRLGVGGAFTTFNGGGVSQPHFAQFN